jgi:DNA helicase-2/ATP-dependent DNA helicase PcrA
MDKNLNIQQKKAVEAAQTPLLIVAGAGTGKTKTLTSRLSFLINSGIQPEKILAITFTNKAAKEMEHRILTNNPGLNPKPFIGTFHSFGARLLREEAGLFGRNKGFFIFDTADSFSLIKKILKELGGKEIKPSLLANFISSYKSTLERTEPPQGLDEDLAYAALEEYENRLKAHNAFDFDDLLEKPVAAFKNNPEVLKKYQNRFDHVLVDEYQDVNDMQYELIRFLTGKNGAVSAVGDAAQTIYTWRGSNIKIFLNFEKDWPNANIIPLEENYRSSANIISAASAVLAGNNYLKGRFEKRLFTKNPTGERVVLAEFNGEQEEASWIAKKISGLVKAGESAAILYRTNAQSRAIEQELIRAGLEYRIFGGLRFYERKEIKDILAGLRFRANQNDEVSRERLEKNILKRRVKIYEEYAPKEEIPASPKDLIADFMRVTGYLEVLDKSEGNLEERKENIAELVRFAGEFSDLSSFLEQVALLQTTDNFGGKKNDASQIILSTIHLAKGLEFDNVFIAGVKEGLIPHGRTYYNEEEIEEERRLLYVAMTRAKKKLFISFFGIPSRFLGALPAEVTQLESANKSRGFLSIDDEERYIEYD